MIKFKNIDVWGFEHSIRGARNPMNSWAKNDSFKCDGNPNEECKRNCDVSCNESIECGNIAGFCMGQNDMDLAKRLIKAGTDHRKFMRQIFVSVDITAPIYWWKEFDTYKVGTVANSTSTMHKIHAKEFTLDDFSCEHLEDAFPGTFIKICDDHITVSPRQLLEDFIIPVLNHNRTEFIETKDKKYWWQMIQLLPSSYNQTRTVTMNYENLLNMYHARKNHKLDEWRVGFCDWVKTLPYAKELIIGEE